MDNRKKILIIAGAAISLVIIVVIGILLFRNKGTTQNNNEPGIVDCEKDPTNKACQTNVSSEEATMIVWGLFDDSGAFQEAIKEFNKQYPKIKVTYVKKQYADYEQSLVDAIASNDESAPDIFIMKNDWLPKHKSKISPAPSSTYDAESFNTTFITAAYNDLVSEGKVYAIPFYMDNLVLFYNKKMFNDNNIYDPPETWDEVLSVSKILTQKVTGNPNEILQSGIALGTTSNITRSSDILLAMMMQTNTPIISQDKRNFTFNQFRKDESGQPYYPGTNALDFYTSFANPETSAYSWNSNFGNNIISFAQGKTAMILGFNYFIPQIEKENPKLSYGIAKFPQIKTTSDERATIANYWAFSVSKNSKIKDIAWDFLKNTVSTPSLKAYLDATGRVSPLKSDQTGIFSEQNNITKTFFKGNADDLDRILNEMIDDVVRYNQTSQSAIDTAARKANDMLAKYQ